MGGVSTYPDGDSRKERDTSGYEDAQPGEAQGSQLGNPVGFQDLVMVADLQRRGWADGLSGCPFVLVDQSPEDPAPPYSVDGQVSGSGGGGLVAVRWPQGPGPMQAVLVVVDGVAIQDGTQVPWSDDEHPVGQLGPDGAARTVRPRRSA